MKQENDNKLISLFIAEFFLPLLILNYYLSNYICNKLNIPFDIELTLMSIGFGYELSLFLYILENIIMIYLLNKMFNIYN